MSNSRSHDPGYWLSPLLLLLLLVLLWAGVLSSAACALFGIGLMLVVLIRDYWPPELAVCGTLSWLMVASLLAPEPFLSTQDALSGLSNPGVVTVALLFIVAAGVQRTGIMERIAGRVLTSELNARQALVRMAAPLIAMSAFLNNTPIVAIFMPLLRDWAIRRRIQPSKLLIPLSYLTIFGGACTLIGTSTNLLVNGLMQSHGLDGMGMFELAKLGVPAAIVGAIYLILAAPRLLPGRADMLGNADSEVREYLLETTVEPNSRLAGKSIDEAGLRDQEGLFLFQVRRGDRNFAPVKREFQLQEGDMLTFAGERDRVLSLNNLPGLSMPHLGDHIDLGSQSQLLEVVISSSSPLLGSTLRQVRFNRKYDATVLAIHRNGERMESQLADTPLRAGDTLLLIAGLGFRRIWQNSADFYLVSPLRQDLSIPKKGPLALIVLILMVLLPTVGLAPLVITAAVAVAALVLGHCLPPHNLFRHVEWNVIAVISAAFGISLALDQSGASALVAERLLHISAAGGVLGALIAVYLLTNLFTEVITNNAAAALMFPIALRTADLLGADARPFILIIAIAASASFATPIGYQTNMMVYGPGGYTYRDYLRIGLPLNLLYAVVSLTMACIWWPSLLG